MYVPDELKVNKFVDVRIPSNKDYFARLGAQSLPEGQYTGDDAATMPANKVDTIVSGEKSTMNEIRAAAAKAADDARTAFENGEES